MLDHLDAGAARRWVRDALEQLSARREEIDALNVYPVPDSDTGTNLCLTVQAGADAVDEVSDDQGLEGVTDAFARGALLGARGSSGVILSQLVRGWADVFRERPDGGPAAVRAALLRAADQAYAAVARPVEGTMLTVARAAADGARGRTLREVVSGAVESARAALGRTTEQLEALQRAGVVDAGGRGLVVVLESLSATVHGRRDPSPGGVRHAVRQLTGAHGRRTPSRTTPGRVVSPVPDRCEAPPLSGPAYEVMYLLAAADADLPALRERLDELGDALVVVGGGGFWNVHVHADDVAAAVRAGISTGHVQRLRVTSFARQRYDRERLAQLPAGVADDPGGATGAGVVVVGVPVECLALMADHGVLALPAAAPADAADEVQHLLSGSAGPAAPLVLVPARPLRPEGGRRGATPYLDGDVVEVLPTQTVVQALAAVSVHDPGLDPVEDLRRMREAATLVRWAEVRWADVRWGDVRLTGGRGRVSVATADGQVDASDQPVDQLVRELVDRLLADDGELLTVLAAGPSGESDDDAQPVLEHVLDQARRRPHVEVTVLPRVESEVPLLQLGVE